jgi:hypothetical protein
MGRMVEKRGGLEGRPASAGGDASAAVRWRHGGRGRVLHPTMLPWLGTGDPVRTWGNEKQASSVPTCGGPARPKKPVRRCFKLRPPWSSGFAGFASGCRLEVSGPGASTGAAAVEGYHPQGIGPKVPGGCPASRPDAHQPARGHRHVRNWAGTIYARTPWNARRLMGQWRLSSSFRDEGKTTVRELTDASLVRIRSRRRAPVPVKGSLSLPRPPRLR